MSKEIDERIVEMRFDNKQFESGAKESMSTLDKLKKKLEFQNAGKSIDDVQKKVNNVQFNDLNNSLNEVSKKLNATRLVAIGVAKDITSHFLASAKRIASEFTIAPIKSGFQEYETQMGAVQTILSNTSHNGTTLDEVNNALNELNHYADKTIYNFTQMTRNIGTFTAAGVNLEDSTNAIKGIANLAAVSGSTAQQASTAMYQLSQALAAGRVSLMDWNSVVNAGMGGKVFQDALIRTSEMMKTGANRAIKKFGSFRESLTQGKWLTTQVLTETLKQLAGTYDEADLIEQGFTEQQAKDIMKLAATAEGAATDVKTFTQMIDTLKETVQSGWTQTWQFILGDFEEAKAMWTEINNAISDIFNEQSEKRNDLLGQVMQTGWGRLKQAGIKDVEKFSDYIRHVAHDDFGVNIGVLVGEYKSLDMAFQESLKTGEISWDAVTTALHRYVGEVERWSDKELEEQEYTKEDVKALKELEDSLGDTRDLRERLVDSGIKGAEDVEEIIRKELVKQKVNVGILIGEYGSLDKAITEGARDGSISYDILEKALNSYTKSLSKLGKEKLKEKGYTEDDVKAAKAFTKNIKDGKINLEEYLKVTEKTLDIKPFFERIGEMGGHEVLFESFKNLGKGLMSVVNPIRDAFSETFTKTPEQVYRTIESFKDLTEKLRLSESQSDKLKRTFKGLFSIIDILLKPVKALIHMISPAIDLSGNLADGILGVTARIGDFFTTLDEEDEKTKTIETAFTNAFTAIHECIEKVINKIKEFVSTIDLCPIKFNDIFDMSGFDANELTLTNFSDSFTKLINDVVGTDIEIENPFENFGKEAEKDLDEKPKFSLFDSTSSWLSELQLKFKDATKWIGTIASDLKDVNYGGILAGGGLVAVLISTVKAMQAAKGISGPLKDIVEVFSKGFSTVGKGLTYTLKALKAYQSKLKSEAILNLAKAIGVLALSLGVLSLIPSGKLLAASGALFTVSAGLAGVLVAMEKLETARLKDPKAAINKVQKNLSKMANTLAKGFKYNQLRKLLKDFTACIIAIVATIALVGYIYTKNASIIHSGAAIVAIVAGVLAAIIATLYFAMNKIAKKSSGLAGKDLVLNMAAVAFNIQAVASLLFKSIIALKILMSMDIPKNWVSRMVMLGLLLFMVGVLVKSIISSGNIANKGVVKAGGSIMAVAFLLISIVSVLAALCVIPVDRLAKSITALGAIFILLDGLVLSIGLIKPKSGAGAAVASVALAIFAITAALGLLSLIPEEQLLKSVLSLGVIMAELAAVFIAMAFNRRYVTASMKTAGAIAVLLMSLAGSMLILSNIPFENMISGIIALSAVVSLLVILVKSISSKSGLKDTKVKSILSISMLIVTMAGALGIVAQYSWSSILSSAVAMTAVMYAVTNLISVISKSGSINLEKITAIGFLVTFMYVIAAALTKMASVPWPNVLAASAGMGLVLLTLTSSIEALGKININWKQVGTSATMMVAALLGMMLIAGVLVKVSSVADPNTLIASALSISSVMGALTVAMGALGVIGQFVGIKGLAIGILAFDAFLLDLAGMFDLLGHLFNEEALATVDRGVQVLGKLGEGLGTFFGSIVGTFIGKASEGFGEIGTNLGAFWDNASGFFNGVDRLTEGFSTKMEGLAKGLVLIMTSGIMEPFSGRSSIVDFSEDLKDAAPNIVSFASKVKDVKGEDIAGATAAIEMMAECQKKLYGTGGFKQAIFGEKSLSAFASELASAAPGINHFIYGQGNGACPGVKDITKKDAQGAKDVISMMSDCANKLYGDNGLKQRIMGDKSLSGFAAELAVAAPGIVAFVNGRDGSPGVSSLTEEGIEGAKKAAEIVKALADAEDDIGNTGGVLGFFVGNNDIGTFGEDMTALGEGLAGFCSKMGELKFGEANSTEKAIEFVTSLAEMELPAPNTLMYFGNDIRNLGNGVADSNTSFESFNIERWNGIYEVLENYKNLAVSLQFVDFSRLTSFGSVLGELSNMGMQANSINMDDMSASVTGYLSTLGTVFESQSETLNNYGLSASLQWLKGFQSPIENITSAAMFIVNYVKQSIYDNSYIVLYNIGQTATDRFISGLGSRKKEIIDAAREIANHAKEGLKDIASDFTTIGKQASEGFKNGLSSKLGEIEDIAAQIGTTTANATSGSLQVGSPSKLMAKIGNFAGLGYINSLKAYVEVAYDESTKLGEATLQGARDGIASISRIIDLDDLSDPTVKPTVDLTNVENSAKSISRMFNDAVIGTSSFATDISYGITKSKETSNVNPKDVKDNKGETNFNYTQINNSPKALSRIDIYRNTRNQLSTMKEVINRA